MKPDLFDGVFRTADNRLVKRVNGEVCAVCGKYGRDTPLIRQHGMHKDFDSYPLDQARELSEVTNA